MRNDADGLLSLDIFQDLRRKVDASEFDKLERYYFFLLLT